MLRARPIDATLSVTRAAQVLGVHPNTIRSWSDAGRLRYYRINPRGDRRYRMGDLQRFLATLGGADPAPHEERFRDGRRRAPGGVRGRHREGAATGPGRLTPELESRILGLLRRGMSACLGTGRTLTTEEWQRSK